MILNDQSRLMVTKLKKKKKKKKKIHFNSWFFSQAILLSVLEKFSSQR